MKVYRFKIVYAFFEIWILAFIFYLVILNTIIYLFFSKSEIDHFFSFQFQQTTQWYQSARDLAGKISHVVDFTFTRNSSSGHSISSFIYF